MSSSRKIRCYCDNEVEITVPELVDLAVNPDAENQILSGEFLSARCDRCGKLLKPEFAFRVVDRGRRIDIQLVPELERDRYLMGKTEYAPDDAECGRIVIGYLELVEKLKIKRAGLDDRVMEIIKYYLLQKAEESDTIEIYFQDIEEGRIRFHIHGLKEGEIGVSRIARGLYDQLLAGMGEKAQEEPFRSIITPPYVSVRKTLIEAEE